MLLQIGYIIYFLNIINKINIIYKFLIKSKKVMYNVLAAKLYKIAYEFDIRSVIKAKLKKILEFIILFI